jgi:predicted HD phosphohydrolase
MQLRRWDDAAKVAGESTPPLAHYLEISARCARAEPVSR